MRKITGIALAGALASTLVLGACGPNVGGSDSKTEAGITDWSNVEPAKEISFWSTHPGGSIDVEQAIIDKFTAETGIKVNLVTGGASYTDLYQKFQTAQTGGEVGDVVVLSDITWFSAYLSGSIIPLDSILEGAGISTDGYHQTFFDDYLYDGQHYELPFARSTPIFYYNKDAYKAAGLGTEGPKTWDEAREFSLKLKEANSKAVPFAYPPEESYPAWTMENLVWGYGGDWSDKWDFSTIVDDKTVEAVQFAKDSVSEGWAAVVQGNDTAFTAGASSQFIGTTGVLKSVIDNADFEVGATMLPLGPLDTDKVVPTGGSGVAIAAKASPERQLAAAMFIGYLTNPESTAYFAAGTGYLPVQKDADMGDTYKEYPLFEVAVNQIERTRPQNYARVFVPGGDKAISAGLNTVLTSDADVKTTLEGVEKELETLYDRDLKSVIEK